MRSVLSRIRAQLDFRLIRSEGGNAQRVFLLLWALAYFLHYAESWTRPDLCFFALSIALASAFLRDIRLAWAVTLLAPTGMLLYKFPDLANHSNFQLFLNLFLIAALFTWKKLPQFLSKVPLYSLCIVYFWAGIHKLNWDFLNPDVSCAVDLFSRYSKIFSGFAPLTTFAQGAWFPWITIALELCIPLLLLFRRSRLIGIAFALILHFFLAPIGFVDFASAALAILVFSLLQELEANTTERRKLLSLFQWYFWLQIAIGCLMALSKFVGYKKLLYLTQAFAWQLIAGIILLILARAIWKGGALPASRSSVRHFNEWHWRTSLWKHALPGVLLIFGSFNYIGLSTAGNFSMFSNVRTEAEFWNHLFIPSGVKIFTYQDQIVWTKEVSDGFERVNRRHPRPGFGMPQLEMFRTYQKWEEKGEWPPRFHVSRQREPASVHSAFELFPPGGDPFRWWEKKMFYFRPVQPEGPNRCRW